MAVNSTHADYLLMLPAWRRARHLLGGEDAIKNAGELYLPRLASQSDEEYAAYKARAVFFNATARTVAGYVGIIFRKPPYIVLPKRGTALGDAMAAFNNDADMLGTSLYGYAKRVVDEVVAVGRCGTLIDWEGDVENRAYLTIYHAEDILNWRVERVNGRCVTTMVVLYERTHGDVLESDWFNSANDEQIRVLKLDRRPETGGGSPNGTENLQCVVEIWRRGVAAAGGVRRGRSGGAQWQLAETRIPLRLGKPLTALPFVFHGPEHSRPGVCRVPLEDVIMVNLSHYRMDADYKHGLHFTALPTAWVSGFEKDATLRIGSSVAWVAEAPGATAGFLEYTGQGLGSFERALDHAERLMAVLGSRLLEGQKKVAETAEAMQIRQGGEESILGSLAASVSESLTQAVRWAYWWHSTVETPELVGDDEALLELNTDFSMKGITAQELTALVAAWQVGAISQNTMFEMLRRSEILPDGRTNEEEAALVKKTVTSNQLSVVSNQKTMSGSQKSGVRSQESGIGQ